MTGFPEFTFVDANNREVTIDSAEKLLTVDPDSLGLLIQALVREKTQKEHAQFNAALKIIDLQQELMDLERRFYNSPGDEYIDLEQAQNPDDPTLKLDFHHLTRYSQEAIQAWLHFLIRTKRSYEAKASGTSCAAQKLRDSQGDQNEINEKMRRVETIKRRALATHIQKDRLELEKCRRVANGSLKLRA